MQNIVQFNNMEFNNYVIMRKLVWIMVTWCDQHVCLINSHFLNVYPFSKCENDVKVAKSGKFIVSSVFTSICQQI